MRTIFDFCLELPAKKSAYCNALNLAPKLQLLCCYLVLLVISGCSSYAVIHNQPDADAREGQAYSLNSWARFEESSDIVFIVAFSGGGTRAAAMAYGVLEELRNTPVVIDGEPSRLLDKISHISSVSGGVSQQLITVSMAKKSLTTLRMNSC